MTRYLLLLVLLVTLPFALPVQAQEAPGIGTCELGIATADLDVGGVRARLHNGSMFGFPQSLVYEVPRGSGGELFFSTNLWVGGIVEEEVRFAGGDYVDWEWWPGPLDDAGNPPADCTAFDRIYLVTQQPDGTLTGDVADWPADLGAPFEDTDGDGVYEPEAGETPTVYGHQTAFWVMNDRGNEHIWSRGEPLGLTLRVTAHTFNTDDPALGFGTFYRYTFENPNTYAVENVRFGFWSETELGNYFDNYAGTDPTRGLTFAYNADDYDEPEGPSDTSFYGAQPPAYGIDFLNGAAGMIYSTGDGRVTGNVNTGEEAYGYLNFVWQDGTPLTVGGYGYNPTEADPEFTTWTWPGAPEQLAFWSEFSTDEYGSTNHPAGGQYPIAVAQPFELPPGATHSVDMAIVWGRGVSFLDSVTKVREHSDRVQAAYDAGTLFAPGGPQTGPPDGAPPPYPAPTLAAPTLTFPENGADLADLDLPAPYCEPGDLPEDCLELELAWDPVPGAVFYEVQIARDPADFDDIVSGPIAPTETFITEVYTDNERADLYWRVRARTATELSPYSEPFTYRTRFRYAPTFQGEGRGIVETSHGGVDPCTTAPAPPGCSEYGGATVWHTPSLIGDYYVAADGFDGRLDRLNFRPQIAAPFDYEMRFTDTCATDGCWGVYTVFGDLDETGLAVRVPFELWQIAPDALDAPVRLIPLVRAVSEGGPGATWPYGVGENNWDGDGFGSADPDAPTSDAIYWMMPDRSDGYALLAADAAAAGAGNPITDSDAQEDPDPTSGETCHNQGFFIDFCHRNDEMPELSAQARAFMAPIGNFQLADQARGGTPPPPGTTIRLLTTKPEPVAAETDGPLPRTLSLAAYPNPTRGTATLAYTLPEAGRTTVMVYDVLGRRVAVLADDETQVVGRHRVTLDTARWAAGVYVAVLETAIGRQTQTLTVLR
ncbi:MAG: T9SS type A sorting domain-containing protein [Bacteroidota bacterium]